jgi:hypothetical protein
MVLSSADVSFHTWPLKEFSPVTMTARLGAGGFAVGGVCRRRAALLAGAWSGREQDREQDDSDHSRFHASQPPWMSHGAAKYTTQGNRGSANRATRMTECPGVAPALRDGGARL